MTATTHFSVHVEFVGNLAKGQDVCDGKRLHVRKVDEYRIALRTAIRALISNRLSLYAAHGGSVSNSYGYRASTEGVVAVATPDGITSVRMCRLPANKVTLSGVAYNCDSAAMPVWDGRYKEASKAAARKAVAEQHAADVAAGHIYLRVVVNPDLLALIRGTAPAGIVADCLRDCGHVEMAARVAETGTYDAVTLLLSLAR